MAQVRVVTDSGADLPAELAADEGITVVPLVVRFGEQVCLDGQLPADEFWRKAGESADHPATSQPAGDTHQLNRVCRHALAEKQAARHSPLGRE